MRKLLYASIGFILFLFAGCSTDEIEAWDAKGFVWFESENVDFTFKPHTELSEGESFMVPIPFVAATKMSDKDRVVNVEVVREPSDSRTQYELQTPVLFRANHVVDTMFVKVVNSKHLDTVHDTISFKVLPSEDFDPGLNENLVTNLCLYNGYARPEWWNMDVEFILGYFTQLKMEVFVNVSGSTDDPTNGNGWFNNISVTYLIVRLNDYVKEHDIRYPDDDPNAPGAQPVFDFFSY